MCILYVKCSLFEITRDFTYRLHIMHRYTKGVKTMTIKQVNTGAHGRKPRYFIENEGGGTVAHFDSLCTAALVLRYLNGAPMTEEDADMAWDAIQAFDTRNEGKRH